MKQQLDLGLGSISGLNLSSKNNGNEDFSSLLKQARILSKDPSNSILRTPPMEAVKRAIKNPNYVPSSSSSSNRNGFHTSASTPEGALGRISLPPSDWGILQSDEIEGDDVKRVSVNDSIKEVLIADDNNQEGRIKESSPTEHDFITPKVKNSDQFNNSNLSSSTSDSEALRAGLRFVLGCYDELSNRINQNANVSDAIISTIAKGHQKSSSNPPPILPRTSSSSSSSSNLLLSKKDRDDSSNQKSPMTRLRSGSILRALASTRRKTSSPPRLSPQSHEAQIIHGPSTEGVDDAGRLGRQDSCIRHRFVLCTIPPFLFCF